MQGPIFDATGIPPEMGSGPVHPIGKFPFGIIGVDIVPNSEKAKDPTGHQYVVELSTPSGKISARFNLWNNNAQSVDIAQKQLSALCHATGVYRLDMNNKGAEMIGARGQVEIRQQANNPNYTEIAKFFDVNGNEPGKAPVVQPAPAAVFTQPAAVAPAPAASPWDKPASIAPAQPAVAPAVAEQPWAPAGAAPPATAPWGAR